LQEEVPYSFINEGETSFLHKILSDDTVTLVTQLDHIVPRDYKWEQAADSCKRSDGDWSVGLTFWWHLVYPQKVLDQAVLPNDKTGKLISTNILKMVCVIINMAAAIFVCNHDNLDLGNFPVLLTSATTHELAPG
jgi:hypothetical protein